MKCKEFLVLTFLCMLAQSSLGQINSQLKSELDSILIEDQKYRNCLAQLTASGSTLDSLLIVYSAASREELIGQLWRRQIYIDSLNLLRTEEIIKRYGYPGRSLVGQPTNEVAWYVIQHSSKIDRYFPLIKAAVKENELPPLLMAMMEDRIMTEKASPQIYGTQIVCYPLQKNTSEQECFVWPIADPKNVNKRRRLAGFPTTVEENAQRFNVRYKALKMKQAKKRYFLGTP